MFISVTSESNAGKPRTVTHIALRTCRLNALPDFTKNIVL